MTPSSHDTAALHLEILHADEDLAVVVKPAGLLSVPGRGPEKTDCVITRLAQRFGWAREVHRLDMDTSGLMIVALNENAMSSLARQFRDREIEKEYIALVMGTPSPDQGTIDLPIRLDVNNRPIRIVDHQHGKPSSTGYETIAADTLANITRLRLMPITGRSHQLRLHCASIGHPILGDAWYGHGPTTDAPRLMLHASKITFAHPVTNERLTFNSEAPF